MSFTLDQLNAFVVVAEEGHFGRAANRLNITQPPLSRQIQTLERQLGVSLLDRTGRRTRLSPAGATFLVEARRILELAASAAESARAAAAGASGVVHLGFTSIVGNQVLPGLLPRLADRQPDLQIVLHEMPTAAQAAALVNGRVDVGLSRPHTGSDLALGLRVRPLASAKLVLATTEGSDLIGRASEWPSGSRLAMPIRELDAAPFIMYDSGGPQYVHDLVTAAFHTYGVRPRIVQRIIETYTMLRLVGAGLGAAIVPSTARMWAPANVVFVDVPELAAYRAESVVAWNGKTRNPAVSTLLSTLKELMPITEDAS